MIRDVKIIDVGSYLNWRRTICNPKKTTKNNKDTKSDNIDITYDNYINLQFHF